MPQFVALIGTQRSGTTVTRSVLNTHPNVCAFGEVFLPRERGLEGCFYTYSVPAIRDNPELCIPVQENLDQLFDGYLDYLEGVSNGEGVIVFDCKYPFLRGTLTNGEGGSGPHSNLFRMMMGREFKFIHLIRENHLATYVSGLLSDRTKVWATDDPTKIQDRTVEVPISTLVDILSLRDQEISAYKRYLSSHMVLTLYYEQLFDGGCIQPEDLVRIANHFGLANRFNGNPEYKKIGLPLSESIRNYEEVRNELEGTPYLHLLEA